MIWKEKGLHYLKLEGISKKEEQIMETRKEKDEQ